MRPIRVFLTVCVLTSGLFSMPVDTADGSSPPVRRAQKRASQPARKGTLAPRQSAQAKRAPSPAKVSQFPPKGSETTSARKQKGSPPSLAQKAIAKDNKPAERAFRSTVNQSTLAVVARSKPANSLKAADAKGKSAGKAAAGRQIITHGSKNRKQQDEDDAERETDLRNWGTQLGVSDESVQKLIDNVNRHKGDPLIPLRVRDAKLKMIKEGMDLPDNISGNPIDVLDDTGKADALELGDKIRDPKFWDTRKKHGVGAALTDELIENGTIPKGIIDPTGKLKRGDRPGAAIGDLLGGKADLEKIGADPKDRAAWRGLKDVNELRGTDRQKGVGDFLDKFGNSNGRPPVDAGNGTGTKPGTDNPASGTNLGNGNGSNSGGEQGSSSDGDQSSGGGSSSTDDGTGSTGDDDTFGNDYGNGGNSSNTPDDGDDDSGSSGDSGSGGGSGSGDSGGSDSSEGGSEPPSGSGGQGPPAGLTFEDEDFSDPPKSEGFAPAPGGFGDPDDDDGSADNSNSGDGDDDDDSDDSDDDTSNDNSGVGYTPSDPDRPPVQRDPATTAALQKKLHDRIRGKNPTNTTPTDDQDEGSGKGDTLAGGVVRTPVRTKIDMIGIPREDRPVLPDLGQVDRPGFGPDQNEILPTPDAPDAPRSGNSGRPITKNTDRVGDDGSGMPQPGGSGSQGASRPGNGSQSSTTGSSRLSRWSETLRMLEKQKHSRLPKSIRRTDLPPSG